MAGVTHDADLAVTGKLSQTGTPTAAGDLTPKSYTDSAVNSTKNIIVRAAATANVTLATAVENGDTLDGVVLATGDTILLPFQTTAADRGIYVVAATGAPTRHSDFDATGDLVAGTVVRVRQGTANIGSHFVVAALGVTPWVPGSSSSTWLKILGILAPYEQAGTVDVSVDDGGTGRSTSTTAYGVLAAGTTATGAHQTISPGTVGHFLKSAGSSALGAFAAIAQSDVASLVTDLGNKQPLATPLTTLAGLAQTTDNFIVSVASAWASRTPAQVKTTLALNNVDNTSDANKPVSTATQTALDGKQAASADLTSLVTNWIQASAAAPSSLDFHEDTDNGAHKINLAAPAAVASDKILTLPDVTATLVADTRSISTTAPLTGGGNLSADRTLAISAASDTAVGAVELLTLAEVSTGTDTTRAMTAAGAAGTYVKEITFTVPGTLVVGAGAARYYLPTAKTISAVRASVGTAPTGASLIVDVNKNGTTIYGTQGNRPTIAISGFTDLGEAASGAVCAAADYLTVDVDQVGSTIAGANLTVTIIF